MIHSNLRDHADGRVQRAILFADNAHKGQKRKYSDPPEDYISHPIAVAEHLLNQWPMNRHWTDVLVVALLHDVLEDTHVTVSDIIENFDENIAARVVQITEVRYPDMDRKARKEFYRSQIAAACDDVKLVKLADVWCNLSDFYAMVRHDKDFAEQYLWEKEKLVTGIRPNADAFGPAMSVLNLIKCHREMYL